MLAARRMMYHSQGAGGVLSKSLISKMTFRSGVAKAPNSTDGSRRIPAPGDPCSLRAPDRTPRWRPIHAIRRTAIGSSARSGSEPNWVNGRYCFGQASRGDHAHSSAPFTGNAQTGARAFAASFRIAPALTIATRPSIHASPLSISPWGRIIGGPKNRSGHLTLIDIDTGLERTAAMANVPAIVLLLS